jgi:predicted phage tail protein
MKIILHGILAEKYGREFEIQTNVPADALEGLSRQLPEWPRHLPVEVIDFPTEELLRAPTDVKEIHVMPAMCGGGGVGKIVIGAVLIVVGVALIAFVPGGQMWGMMAISLGASFLMAGISELSFKAPTVDKSNDPPPSKYLGINVNTTAIGTLIIMAWGKIKLGGHWLSLQSDSSDLVTTSFPATTS